MTDTTPDNQQREIKKRPRPVISCLQCRQKKLKCDRLLPCQQCIKGGRTERCAYADGQEPELRQDVEQAEANGPKRARLLELNAPTAVLNNVGQVDSVLDRLQSLERALQAQQEKYQSRAAGSHVTDPENEHDLLLERKSGKLSMRDFHLASQFIQALPSLINDAEIVSIAQETYAIQQSLKMDNARSRAPYSAAEGCMKHMLRLLPAKKSCESLMTLYFENFEHCARILHRPTFLRQYQGSVNDTLPATELESFVPLLTGILLIASLLNTLEECELPLLRGESDGIGAMQLLQNWLDLQGDEARYTIPVLQVRLLLLLAMKLQGYDDRALWTLSGQLLRDAMIMDLDSTPSADTNALGDEIRKRLWVTVCELDLAHAICIGMPASIHPLDESRIPLNIDDEDLSALPTTKHQSRSTNEWTDGLCQHVLGQTFNARLEAYNYALRKEPLRYSEVLNKARALEHIAFALPSTFKLDHNNPPGRLLAQIEVDVSLRRPLIALYTPFALVMPVDDRYRDARIGWVQANLVILCFQDLFDPKFPAIDVPRPEGYWDLYYTIYRMDDIKGLHAELLELQRMKDPLQKGLDGLGPGLQQHPHRSGSRALGWTVKGMEESVEDTIDPWIRRVDRDGSCFGLIVRYQLAYESLLCENAQDLILCIRSGLKMILQTVRSKLQRQGHSIPMDGHRLPDDQVMHWFASFLAGETPKST